MSASKTIPSTYEALEAMRAAGGWYIRRRKRVRPALWRSTDRGTFAPARPKDVEAWLRATYPDFETLRMRDLRVSALEVIAEAKYHDYGLPVLADEMLELIQ